MGKPKYLSAFERGMVVGARNTGLSPSIIATLLWCSRSTVSRVYKECSTTQRTSSQLDVLESTRVSIPVECFRHLVESMPQRIEAVLMAKGEATQ